jgi:three-Cys-motif partner protein
MDDFEGVGIDPALLDEIGAWSRRKHAILQEYSRAYGRIMSNAKRSVLRFEWDYVDGFAGAGLCREKETGEIVKGSALNSLEIEPPFSRFVFVELDPERYRTLRSQTIHVKEAECINGDANVVLPRDVVPRYEFKKYRRALVLLDPYQHKHLKWNTIRAIGESGTMDLLLHFPTMPMNRGALRRDGEVPPEEATAMAGFWGNDDWRAAAYVARDGLFSDVGPEKATDLEFAAAFCERLKIGAGFHGTSPPIPMLNSNGATMYYLIFALPNQTATDAATGVAKYFRKHPTATGRHRGKSWSAAI